MEGHWRRLDTPLRRLTSRERAVLIGGLSAIAVAIVALLLATASGDRPAPGPGCIYAVVAGRTGGEPIHACGREAVAICERASALEGPWAESVSGACHKAGIRAAAPPAAAGTG